MRITRLARILHVSLRHGLDGFVLAHPRLAPLSPFVNGALFWRDLSSPRGVRLRRALEDLGPIFVKFGQMLSTRRDLLPTDIADELALLQDRVPPFPGEAAVATLERVYGRPIAATFARFDTTPVASASVAQVHLAELHDGTPVAVKILRPDIHVVIEKDLALMHTAARLVEKVSADGRRLRPARSSPSSRRRFATSSTSRARRPTARSCAATSPTRRSCACRSCTGTLPTAT